MDSWAFSDQENESPAKDPPRKKLKLSLSKDKLPAGTSRWQHLTDTERESLSVKHIPKNTEASTRWAVANFNDWVKSRNSSMTNEEQVPSDILRSTDCKLLCKWLSAFVAETRKKDGTPYPPKSLYILLAGVLRHMRSLNEDSCPNFLDTNDKRFSSLHSVLDNVFRQLRTAGVGSSPRHAGVFTKEEEALLWDKNILGIDTPKQLLRAVFFMNGRNFCLRGGEEQRALKLSQLKRYTEPDHYVYTELASKNRAGGLRQMKVENKVVPVYANPEIGMKCHVALLDLYISKLPPSASSKDVFYLQPLQKVPADSSKPWFICTPVGRNTLSTMVKTMSAEAGLGVEKTNHSLRATGASRMFNSGVPEKVIQQRSGHLSIQGVRQYERVTDEQQEAACRVLSSTENTSFAAELDRTPSGSEAVSRSSCQAVAQPLPQGQFTGCTFNIYQGAVTQNLASATKVD